MSKGYFYAIDSHCPNRTTLVECQRHAAFYICFLGRLKRFSRPWLSKEHSDILPQKDEPLGYCCGRHSRQGDHIPGSGKPRQRQGASSSPFESGGQRTRRCGDDSYLGCVQSQESKNGTQIAHVKEQLCQLSWCSWLAWFTG